MADHLLALPLSILFDGLVAKTLIPINPKSQIKSEIYLYFFDLCGHFTNDLGYIITCAAAAVAVLCFVPINPQN
jgi:hypothetical protein